MLKNFVLSYFTSFIYIFQPKALNQCYLSFVNILYSNDHTLLATNEVITKFIILIRLCA